jgi:DNA-binding NarL/FixJ family response regulator
MYVDAAMSSTYIDDMGVNPDECGRLVAAATSDDPEAGLAAVVGLRQLAEVLEELQVAHARRLGWSWRDIARRLGVSKQAVHYKHGIRTRRAEES